MKYLACAESLRRAGLSAAAKTLVKYGAESGIIIRPNWARMSDELLEMLMFLKCNA